MGSWFEILLEPGKRNSVDHFGFCPPFRGEIVIDGHCLMTLSPSFNKTWQWLTPRPILMQFNYSEGDSVALVVIFLRFSPPPVGCGPPTVYHSANNSALNVCSSSSSKNNNNTKTERLRRKRVWLGGRESSTEKGQKNIEKRGPCLFREATGFADCSNRSFEGKQKTQPGAKLLPPQLPSLAAHTTLCIPCWISETRSHYRMVVIENWHSVVKK